MEILRILILRGHYGVTHEKTPQTEENNHSRHNGKQVKIYVVVHGKYKEQLKPQTKLRSKVSNKGRTAVTSQMNY